MAISLAMDATPDPDATLTELAALGLRAARVVTRMMEIEQAAAEIVAGRLPEPGVEPASLAEATLAGHSVDGVAEAMTRSVPRVEILARALDRISRSVRHSIALMRRMQAGWPHRSDNRAVMVRRQIGRAVAEVIRRESDGEAAERLFDELAERLDDPERQDAILALPVDQVVRRICRDLGLTAAALAPLAEPPPPPYHDTG
jgi:hypothetical protein